MSHQHTFDFESKKHHLASSRELHAIKAEIVNLLLLRHLLDPGVYSSCLNELVEMQDLVATSRCCAECSRTRLAAIVKRFNAGAMKSGGVI